MVNNARTQRSIKNSIYAVIGQLFTIILNFASRTIFISSLGAVYLGINGLFTNILSVLSFAELGFSTAIIYEMYKPLAKQDEKIVSGLMNFYQKVYQSIGLGIFLIGLILIPYLEFFIKDISVLPNDIPPLWIIYLLFLINTSSSYLFNYKRSIIVASQNGYIDSKNQLLFNVVKNVLQIIILLLLNSFIGFLIIQLLCTFAGNITISKKADKLFPYLNKNKKERISKSILRSIKKNVIAQSFNKLGGVVVSGIDNLFIAKFVGVIAVGCYSNYLLIITTLKTLFTQIFTPVTASIGDFMATNDKESSFLVFKKILFINVLLSIIFSVCLSILINPFISIFWGESYVFDKFLVLAIIFNFYVDRIRLTSQMFMDARGLFWQIKWRSVCEASINIILCLIFTVWLDFGLKGIICTLLLCNLFINFWWEAFIVFKYLFDKSILVFLKLHFMYLIVLIVTYICSDILTNQIPNNYTFFFLKVIITIVISIGLPIIFFYKTNEFKYMKSIIFNYLHKK